MGIKIKSTVDAGQGARRLQDLHRQATRTAGSRGKGIAAHVGIFSTATYTDGTSVALVGRALNYGTLTTGGYIPPRPFLTLAFKDPQNARALRHRFALEMGRAQPLPLGYLRALHRVATWAVTIIQRRIASWAVPPNSSATIARKGTDAPLRDTGLLRKSVTYEIK